MSADILLPRANLVPVGTDNQGNVELAREIARRFNRNYGEVFPIPQIELEATLIGTDGQAKMSKSLNNAIFLSDSSDVVEEKVMGMYTDPNRTSADVPGRVEGNPVFIYHDNFNPDIEQVKELKERYQKGKVGDVEVKRKLAQAVNQFLDPLRTRREKYARQPEIVLEILSEGSRRMQIESEETLQLVRDTMGLQQYQKTIVSDIYQEPARVLEGLAFV